MPDKLVRNLHLISSYIKSKGSSPRINASVTMIRLQLDRATTFDDLIYDRVSTYCGVSLRV